MSRSPHPHPTATQRRAETASHCASHARMSRSERITIIAVALTITAIAYWLR